MASPTLRLHSSLLLLPLASLALACGDSASDGDVGDCLTSLCLETSDGGTSTDTTTESGDTMATTGDGDGDTGDGDGDPGDGDGDGDGDTGDGDGDTGDGDGDGDTGDGDTGDGDGDTEATFCDPGATSCFDPDSVQTCVDDGSEWGPPVPCEDTEGCLSGDCVPLCDLIEVNPSSVGCSFFANRMDNLHANQPDSLVIGNVSSDKSVTAQLYFVPNNQNVEQAQGPAVMVGPEGTHTFQLDNAQIESVTTKRTGGVYRVETDIPIVAYLHSPIGSQATNDASMLLPEHALTGNYVVASYPGTFHIHYPGYFTAIATQDDTTLDFLAGGPTAAGGGVPGLMPGQSAQVAMQRYDTLNVVVAAQYQDLSGTIITADKPVWVAGASECANVPMHPTLYCDHLEEVLLPLEYWGEEYVGAHAPQRGNETYYWRVYGGEDGITVNTAPQQPGFPLQLDKGEYYQFGTQASFVFTGDGPFLPVQLLEGQNGGAGTGDPSMYQMVPTEQFLDTYAFVTGTNYSLHYAQIIRPAGGDDIMIDDVVVDGYYQIGAWDVADYQVTEGAHFATSTQPFGIIQVGYTNVTSYAYPGGLQLAVINPQ
ncbi:hypothetical protein ENSA5_36580 [Enhygromyxa salina]|uniref:IgGFc-binding protein N-terminal domain-containing protein n=1 Tax=Enhygromyxa salina TaxID=215803 RepID=A0A2S9XUP9_9BACT|nr:IgGFc-binding protein [Enhygromyxa salina]PRP96582.1 hypothetical protein ENSA5_36580 [Enhygromyxa salina]